MSKMTIDYLSFEELSEAAKATARLILQNYLGTIEISIPNSKLLNCSRKISCPRWTIPYERTKPMIGVCEELFRKANSSGLNIGQVYISINPTYSSISLEICLPNDILNSNYVVYAYYSHSDSWDIRFQYSGVIRISGKKDIEKFRDLTSKGYVALSTLRKFSSAIKKIIAEIDTAPESSLFAFYPDGQINQELSAKLREIELSKVQ